MAKRCILPINPNNPNDSNNPNNPNKPDDLITFITLAVVTESCRVAHWGNRDHQQQRDSSIRSSI